MAEKTVVEERTETPKELTWSCEWDDSLFGTTKINFFSYKEHHNSNILLRTKYAAAGLFYMLRRERPIQHVLISAAIIFPLAFWLDVGRIPLVLIFLSFALLWAVETLNTALEAVVDRATQHKDPFVKVAKDTAASATMVSVLTVATTALVFLGPPLLEKINDLLAK